MVRRRPAATAAGPWLPRSASQFPQRAAQADSQVGIDMASFAEQRFGASAEGTRELINVQRPDERDRGACGYVWR